MPVAVPQGVDVSIKDDQISVKGAGGTCRWPRTHWSK
jgi:large subunit ribosomal protein L6